MLIQRGSDDVVPHESKGMLEYKWVFREARQHKDLGYIVQLSTKAVMSENPVVGFPLKDKYFLRLKKHGDLLNMIDFFMV